MSKSQETKPSLGTGERFRRLVAKLRKRGVANPEALAAWIGRKVYGKEYFQKLAALGKKRSKSKRMNEGESEISENEALAMMEELLSQEDSLEEEEAGLLSQLIDELERAYEAEAVSSAFFERSSFLEARDGQGKEWEVLLIQPGASKNGNYYSQEVLEQAAPLFEGKKAFADHATEEERRARPERSVRDVVGWFDGVRAEARGLISRFHILECAQWLRTMLLDAYRQGKRDLVGFSIDAQGKTSLRRIGGELVRFVESIERVHSVDVVTEPAAGGQVARLVASHHPGSSLVVGHSSLINDKRQMTNDKRQKEEIHMEELKAAQPEGVEELGKRLKELECQLTLKEALYDAQLPLATKKKIERRFKGREFDTTELHEALQEEKDYLAAFSPSGQVRGLGQGKVESGLQPEERLAKALDGFFFGQAIEGVRPFRSLQEAFREITGRNFLDSLSGTNRLKESLTTASFDQILADSITRRMVKEYQRPDLSNWRNIVEVVAVSDFRTQRRMRFGGYANLPAVAQGASYGALTSPSDEEATYTPAKRGGTEDLTLEMIKNDDVGAIRRIPTRLGRAAAQTIHEFVFDILKDNPTIYDGTALFTAGHGNLGSAALSSASLVAGRNAMLKQTELNSAKRLALKPKYLVVPIDLEETAFQLITSDKVVGSAENQPNFIKVFGLELLVVEYWTDTNNWFLVADSGQVPTTEIGFLEGREEPDLFVQDMENVGSMFTADKVSYKIRHIYGGAVMDYRGLYGALVA